MTVGTYMRDTSHETPEEESESPRNNCTGGGSHPKAGRQAGRQAGRLTGKQAGT